VHQSLTVTRQVLVIDLFGPNLEDLFDMCGRKFSTKTVCMLAKQMVRECDYTSRKLGVDDFTHRRHAFRVFTIRTSYIGESFFTQIVPLFQIPYLLLLPF
jgi:hypothetical protein